MLGQTYSICRGCRRNGIDVDNVDCRGFSTNSVIISQIQLAFAKCAEDIKTVHEQSGRDQASVEWTGSALGSVTVLFSRAGRTQDAWYVCGCQELFGDAVTQVLSANPNLNG